MREILFRGKRKDSGEWVYGSLVVSNDSGDTVFMIIPSDAKHWGGAEFNVGYIVDPETICQYTGMNDCVDTKIFENDVFIDVDNECVGVVEFYNGGFCINWYGKDGLMMPYGYDECAGEWGLFEVEPCSESYIEDLEVICNTHDNPEILKGDVSWRTLKKQQ